MKKIMDFFKGINHKKLIIVLVSFAMVLVSLVAVKTINQIRKNVLSKNIIKTPLAQYLSTKDSTGEFVALQPSPSESSVLVTPSPTTSSTPTPSSFPSSSPSLSPSSTPSSTPSSYPSPSPTSSSGLASCGSNYSFFNTSPVELSVLAGLVPLGNYNPSGHVFPTDHIYPKINNNSEVALYSPGDIVFTSISASQNITQGTTDYSIYFQPCDELKVYFLHVISLTGKLANQPEAPYQWEGTYSTGGNTYRNYGKNVNISVSAGEQIGTVRSFDMGAYDTRMTLNFANSSRWQNRSDYTHTVCPINYYSGSLKDTLMAKFGNALGTLRTIEPICGAIEQDIVGTAQGNWFLEGTDNAWSGEDPHLALIHDNIDPTKGVFSIGTSMSANGQGAGGWIFSPSHTLPDYINKDFNEVSANGHVYCYTPYYLSGRLILEMPNATTLKIERQDGNCDSPPWVFSGNATTFER